MSSFLLAAPQIADNELLCADVDCGSRGTCVEGTCECAYGYTGSTCEVSACDTVSCFDEGFCAAGECLCKDGFVGNCGSEYPFAYPEGARCVGTDASSAAISDFTNGGCSCAQLLWIACPNSFVVCHRPS